MSWPSVYAWLDELTAEEFQAALDAAKQDAANPERGRPTDVDLRRGISAAYYAVFHELTGQAASHLVGFMSSADSERDPSFMVPGRDLAARGAYSWPG